MALCAMRRCVITTNPCGTDTWAKGHPCKCDQCQAWLSEELDRRYFDLDAYHKLLVAAENYVRLCNGEGLGYGTVGEVDIAAKFRTLEGTINAVNMRKDHVTPP